ncbi:MAG: hypothetical protein OEY22_07295 [Candidatus Bathyarchaeota archaeon]|nr:hypothetical protein [Candidatus Bathyarchaeota archaeon]MDH5787621.1 hypothetical protein [Candidatus Bathyarchaeota archaeon]
MESYVVSFKIFRVSSFESSLVFYFFLLVNFSGAILGCWIRKTIPEEFLEGDVLHYFSKYLFLTLLFISIVSFTLLPFFMLLSFYSMFYVASSELILIPAAVAAVIRKAKYVQRQEAEIAEDTP